MSPRNRVFLGIVAIYVLSVGFLLVRTIGDLETRYRESAEESLVDTAYLLASFIERSDGLRDPDSLQAAFRGLYGKRFEARIYGLTKPRVDLRVYVTDLCREQGHCLARPGTARKGTGLGLAFVREIAQLHSGTRGWVMRRGGVEAVVEVRGGGVGRRTVPDSRAGISAVRERMYDRMQKKRLPEPRWNAASIWRFVVGYLW